MFEIAAKTANFGLTSSSPTATALHGSIITGFRVIAKTFHPADLIKKKLQGEDKLCNTLIPKTVTSLW